MAGKSIDACISDFERYQRNCNAASTDALLDALREHHDFNFPVPVTKADVIRIASEPEEPVPVEIGILPVVSPKITVNAIQRIVSQHFGISHADMLSARRNAKVQRPRAVAMYLAREFTTHGYPPLGRFFNRDHTSVLHSVRKMEGIVKSKTDPIANDVEYLREVLSA
jgi:hypothetical protein